MVKDFGKGFTPANLANMRQFYLTFSNFYALRSELSWTHYRMLMRVENENARQFYLEEAFPLLHVKRGLHLMVGISE